MQILHRPSGIMSYILLIMNRSSLKYLHHRVGIDYASEVWNYWNRPGRVGWNVNQKRDPNSNWCEGEPRGSQAVDNQSKLSGQLASRVALFLGSTAIYLQMQRYMLAPGSGTGVQGFEIVLVTRGHSDQYYGVKHRGVPDFCVHRGFRLLWPPVIQYTGYEVR